MPEPEAASQETPWHDLQPLLDRELSRLAEKYRLPIVLCDLEGKSRKDAAQQLRLPEGTLSSRLTRARAKLAGRLSRRGLVLPGAVLATVLTQKAAPACVPAPLVSSTVQSAMIVLAGPAAAGGVISAPVAALTEGVLKAMLLNKLKLATLGVLTAGFVFAGAAVSTHALTPKPKASGEEKAPPPRPKEDRQSAHGPTEKKGTDSAPAPKESRVRALLKERLDILRAGAVRARRRLQMGTAGPEIVRQAEIRVLKAELELCETDKERVAVQKKIVDLWKEMEDRVRRLHQTGAASEEIVQDATLNRLEAEIDLERLKEKVNPPK